MLFRSGLKNTYHNIKTAYLWSKAKTKVVIEGTAEGGKRLTLENAVFFIENSKNLNLGLCIDTAHVYAAGYNVIETIEKYHKYVTVIHLNNPNPEVLPGKHLDRHNISLFSETARLTKTEIENIMILADLYNIPMILETGEPSNDLMLCENVFVK